MRMWMLDPNIMCTQHILGEHAELHKHLPSLLKGVSIHGRMKPVVQIQLNALLRRHDQLAQFLKNHKSPLVFDESIIKRNYSGYYNYVVDLLHNANDLSARCSKCAEKIEPRLEFVYELSAFNTSKWEALL